MHTAGEFFFFFLLRVQESEMFWSDIVPPWDDRVKPPTSVAQSTTQQIVGFPGAFPNASCDLQALLPGQAEESPIWEAGYMIWEVDLGDN